MAYFLVTIQVIKPFHAVQLENRLENLVL